MHNPALLSRRSFCVSALFIAAAAFSCAGATKTKQDLFTPCFTDAERESVRLYWNTTDRYTVLPSDAPERINVTIEGSTWWLAASKAIAAEKKTDPDTANQWQSWWDKHFAQQKAVIAGTTPVPPDPGPIPPAFAAACPTPLPGTLYEKVQPVRYTVTFASSDAPEPFLYEDGIDFGKRAVYYPYYRSKNGVMRAGKKVRDITGDDKKRLDAIFAKAGRSPFERRVVQAVSQYEGGFEAINTYDTGYVSIGFIQFITAIDGKGSLSEVLQYYKSNDRNGFQNDFRRFGIDVSPDGTLVCVDPVTGQEVRGMDAVRRVIDDKRLTAVFERAGAGDGFKLAQVAVARAHYWPGDDLLTVVVQDKQVVSAALLTMTTSMPPTPDPASVSCPVSAIIKSEAGMATLMDKKVNRGNIRDFADVARQLMDENKLTDPRDLAKYERTIIATMKYRGDFLSDPTLSQPAAIRRSRQRPVQTAEEEPKRPARRRRAVDNDTVRDNKNKDATAKASDAPAPRRSRSTRSVKVATPTRDIVVRTVDTPRRISRKPVHPDSDTQPKPRIKRVTRVAETLPSTPAKRTKKRH